VLDQPVDRRTPRHPLRDACHPRITDRSASFETSAEDLAGNVGHVVIRLAAPAERQIPDAQRGPRVNSHVASHSMHSTRYPTPAYLLIRSRRRGTARHNCSMRSRGCKRRSKRKRHRTPTSFTRH
jgi:hypothetical protein